MKWHPPPVKPYNLKSHFSISKRRNRANGNRAMEIGQLRAFLAVVETSSVTRAAAAMGLTPGPVSQQLRALASELGTELFVRSGKRIAPTAQSHRLAEHAR